MTTIQTISELQAQITIDREAIRQLECRVLKLEGRQRLESGTIDAEGQTHVNDGDEPIYVVFDFETTGLSKHCQIVQVAAMTCADEFATFKSDVKPTIPVDAGAQKIHGISEERLTDADEWITVGACFFTWLEALRRNARRPIILLAHNAKRFDTRVLVSECRRCNHPLPSNMYHADTIDVFKRLLPNVPGEKKMKLSMEALHTLVFNSPIENAHDAMGDVVALKNLLHAFNWKPVVHEVAESLETYVQRVGQ